jgi:hypothetical protein
VGACPSAKEVQQIVSITAKSGVGDTANPLTIEKAISPGYFVFRFVYNAKGALGVIDCCGLNDAEYHGRACSNRQRNWLAFPPLTKKLFGSWPSGNGTRRADTP